MICDALIFKYLEFSHALTICYAAPEWVAPTIRRNAESATAATANLDSQLRLNCYSTLGRARWRPLRRDGLLMLTALKLWDLTKDIEHLHLFRLIRLEEKRDFSALRGFETIYGDIIFVGQEQYETRLAVFANLLARLNNG